MTMIINLACLEPLKNKYVQCEALWQIPFKLLNLCWVEDLGLVLSSMDLLK